jgi:hypothetical protein
LNLQPVGHLTLKNEFIPAFFAKKKKKTVSCNSSCFCKCQWGMAPPWLAPSRIMHALMGCLLLFSLSLSFFMCKMTDLFSEQRAYLAVWLRVLFKERVWQCGCGCFSKNVFDSVVAGAFQIVFRAKIHVNDVFLFFKNHF